MTITLGTNTGLYVKTGAIATDPAPQASRNFTLAETVDGDACEMQFVHYAGSSGIRLTVDGTNWINTPGSKGQGIHMGADNIFPAGYTVAQNVQSPTQGGSQRDGTSVLTGSTNVVYVAVAADGKSAYVRFAPAYWCQPNQELVPTVPALNKSLVSDMVSTNHIEWGYDGDAHIIRVSRDVVVPNRTYVAAAQVLDCVTLSLYGTDSIFDTVHLIDPTDGALEVYAGFPATSNTQAIMTSSADDTKAMFVFHPLGEYGPTGYAQELTAGGFSNIFIRCKEEVVAPAGITPGTRHYNGFMGIVNNPLGGARAAAAAKVVTLYNANITRSTDIVLPDVA